MPTSPPRSRPAPPISLRDRRQLIGWPNRLRRGLDNRLDEQLALEARLQAEAGRSHDFREGVMAFRGKRPARYRGHYRLAAGPRQTARWWGRRACVSCRHPGGGEHVQLSERGPNQQYRPEPRWTRTPRPRSLLSVRGHASSRDVRTLHSTVPRCPRGPPSVELRSHISRRAFLIRRWQGFEKAARPRVRRTKRRSSSGRDGSAPA